MTIKIYKNQHKTIYSMENMEVVATKDGIVINDLLEKKSIAVFPEEMDALVVAMGAAKGEMERLKRELER